MNALAAMALADAVGIPQVAAIGCIVRFTGLAHRCQFVREVNGVRWINDSKQRMLALHLAAVAGVGESVRDVCGYWLVDKVKDKISLRYNHYWPGRFIR